MEIDLGTEETAVCLLIHASQCTGRVTGLIRIERLPFHVFIWYVFHTNDIPLRIDWQRAPLIIMRHITKALEIKPAGIQAVGSYFLEIRPFIIQPQFLAGLELFCIRAHIRAGKFQVLAQWHSELGCPHAASSDYCLPHCGYHWPHR